MDVPIEVAIISVGGSLAGTITGGAIVTWGNYYLARWRQQAEDNKEARIRADELRKACRLIEDELSFVWVEVGDGKRWWYRELATESWEQCKDVLADLPFSAWTAAAEAVRAVQTLRTLAALPRPTEAPEAVPEPILKAILGNRDAVDVGRRALRPYSVDARDL
jgi:hypothetical protein